MSSEFAPPPPVCYLLRFNRAAVTAEATDLAMVTAIYVASPSKPLPSCLLPRAGAGEFWAWVQFVRDKEPLFLCWSDCTQSHFKRISRAFDDQIDEINRQIDAIQNQVEFHIRIMKESNPNHE